MEADDDNTVVVRRTEGALSPEQKADLDAQLSSINPTMSLTEELLVHQFTTTKIFVGSHVSNTSNS